MLIGFVEIAGYGSRLRAGLEALGCAAVQVDLSAHPFGYARAHTNPRVVRFTEAVGRRRAAARNSELLVKAFWKATELVARLALLVWAIPRFDAFVLMFGTSFIGGREFWLLRRLHKRLIVVYFGSDTRPPYMDGADYQFLNVDTNSRQCAARSRAKKRLVRQAERHATATICHPPSAQFLERPFVNFLDVGIPLPSRTASGGSGVSEAGTSPQGSLRILHAPSNPSLKGTPRLRAAVEELRAAGRTIDLIEVVGQPNDVVLRELAACDVVFDQLYSDSPMAGFAAEAAAFGKPTIVGSFDWPEIEREVGASAPPTYRCHPDDLVSTVALLADDVNLRLRLGEAAHRFVEHRWRPEQVAERYLRIIAGDVPPDWMRDPRDLRYVAGWGLDVARVAATVRRVIDDEGVAALQVTDKPLLEQRLVELARA